MGGVLSRAVVGKFVGGVNWLEINNIVNVLMTRFPRQPEAMHGGENGEVVGTRSNGAPAEVLRILFPETIPVPESQAWPVFDHRNAVTAGDHCFGSEDEVVRHPAIHIGCWNNIAEIAIMSGIALYDCTNIENRTTISLRIFGSTQDGKERAAFLRRGVEEWKRGQQLGDEHLRPDLFPRLIGFWESLVYGTNPEEGSLSGLLRMWLGGNTVIWNWDLGRYSGQSISYTGIRTSPEMWKTELASTHKNIDLDSTCYRLCTREGDWRQYSYQQIGDGVDEYRKERDLMKVDVLSQRENFNIKKICTTAYHP
jgi:hypothetical protein